MSSETFCGQHITQCHILIYRLCIEKKRNWKWTLCNWLLLLFGVCWVFYKSKDQTWIIKEAKIKSKCFSSDVIDFPTGYNIGTGEEEGYNIVIGEEEDAKGTEEDKIGLQTWLQKYIIHESHVYWWEMPNSKAVPTIASVTKYVKSRSVGESTIQMSLHIQSWDWEHTPEFTIRDVGMPASSKQRPTRNVELAIISLQRRVGEYFLARENIVEAEKKVQYCEFPIPECKKSTFINLWVQPEILLVLWFFTLGFNNLVSSVVRDKQNRIKEGIKTFGMFSLSYWLSYFFIDMIILSTVFILFTGVIWWNEVAMTSPILIFIFLLLGSCGIVSYALLLSTLFEDPRIASTLSTIGFLASTSLFLKVKQNNVSFAWKALVSLLPNLCLCLQMSSISYWESHNGLSWHKIWIEVENWTPAFGLLIMVFDIFYMLGLLIYLDEVMPKKIGTSKKCCFCLKPIKWFCWPERNINNEVQLETLPSQSDNEYASDESAMVEEYPTLLAEQKANNTGIVLKDLRKVFVGGGLQEKIIAVDKMNLNIFQNHVTAILGHNGAGKTTLINMITGMLQPTSGTIVIGNVEVSKESYDFGLKLGLCPQDSIIFPLLTVDEHLIFIGALRNLSNLEVNRQADELLDKINLLDRRSHLANSLSGGEERKLSVIMALMGDPKFIFLDEPTAGLDSLSRRKTWKLIQDYKQGKTIILTTHFMDEADYLSDRIAIMANGQLRICGSSLFLKSRCGVGYTLSIYTRADGNCNKIEETPLGGSQGPGKEVTCDMVLKRVKEIVPFQILTKGDVKLQLRIGFGEADKFPKLFEMLDQLGGEDDNWSKRSLTYSLSVTTLDEVFVQIAREDVSGLKRKLSRSLDDLVRRSSIQSSGQNDPHRSTTFSDEFQKIQSKSSTTTERSLLTGEDCFAQRPKTKDFFCDNLCALLQKRFRWSRWDYRAAYLILFWPIICNILGIFFVSLFTEGVEQSKSMVLDLSDGKTEVLVFGDFDALTSSYGFSETSHLKYKGKLLTEAEIEEELCKQPQAYGAFKYDSNGLVLFFNPTALHSLPILLLEYQNLFLGSQGSKGSMVVNWFRLKTPEELWSADIFSPIGKWIFGFVASFGLMFISAQAVTFPVREREVKAMHQQVISGMSILAYWLSNIIHDIILMAIPILSVVLLIKIFGPEKLKANCGCICILYLLYGTASHGMAYFVSFLFSSPDNCQIFVNTIQFVAVTLWIFCSFTPVDESWEHEPWKNWQFYIRLIPSTCLYHAIVKLLFMDVLQALIPKLVELAGLNPLDTVVPAWDAFDLVVTGWDIMFLIIDSFLYFSLAVCVEYTLNNSKFRKYMYFKPRNVPDVQSMEDENVKIERSDILNKRRENSTIILKGIRMVYGTGCRTPAIVAVNDLWFSVAEGEIFGLLGANGAGKTTTMSILTGGDVPSSGSASLLGLDILEDQGKLRRNFGFCSQSNTVFDLLTGRQTLEFYAKIKGIHAEHIPKMVKLMMETLQLKKFADQKVVTYSGGNKRKLCVAIALIGGPRIVFLDEPSAGVDPVARRWIWKFIQDKMTGRTVILTTHAIDEAEILCNRIGIMVSGQLRCIGTPEELKSKYVQGYILECHLREDKDGEESLVAIKQYVENTFPGSEIFEEHYSLIKFKIPPGTSFGHMFKVIESEKENLGILQYALSETSLEEVFLSFVRDEVIP